MRNINRGNVTTVRIQRSDSVSALELNYWSELLDSGITQAVEDVEIINLSIS